jgi:hypothetical protein
MPPGRSPLGGLPRLPLLLAGAVVVVAAAVFAGVELTRGHGLPPPPSVLPPAVVPTTTTTTVPAPPLASFPLSTMKDPFAPLVPPYATVAPVPSSTTTSTTTPTTVTTTEPTVVSTTEPTTVPTTEPSAPPTTAAPAPTTAPSTGSAPTAGEQVALLDVYTYEGEVVAEVRVDNTVYPHLAPGQVFATDYKVVSLDEQTACGQFLHGDSEFGLCKGQEILE